MGKTNKKYTAAFKAKVAIEAVKEMKTSAEICSEYKIPSTNLYEWRDRMLSKAPDVFIAENEHSKAKKALSLEIEALHKIIGELTVENNYFKKKLLR